MRSDGAPPRRLSRRPIGRSFARPPARRPSFDCVIVLDPRRLHVEFDQLPQRPPALPPRQFFASAPTATPRRTVRRLTAALPSRQEVTTRTHEPTNHRYQPISTSL